jgi:predicted GNAT superfamily acetyltransferase
MSTLLAANLHDHAAAAATNLADERGFLEQAVYVDQISEASAAHLHGVARQAWQQAFKTLMREAQRRFDHDATLPRPEDRRQRARFGVYFYNEPDGS